MTAPDLDGLLRAAVERATGQSTAGKRVTGVLAEGEKRAVFVSRSPRDERPIALTPRLIAEIEQKTYDGWSASRIHRDLARRGVCVDLPVIDNLWEKKTEQIIGEPVKRGPGLLERSRASKNDADNIPAAVVAEIEALARAGWSAERIYRHLRGKGITLARAVWRIVRPIRATVEVGPNLGHAAWCERARQQSEERRAHHRARVHALYREGAGVQTIKNTLAREGVRLGLRDIRKLVRETGERRAAIRTTEQAVRHYESVRERDEVRLPGRSGPDPTGQRAAVRAADAKIRAAGGFEDDPAAITANREGRLPGRSHHLQSSLAWASEIIRQRDPEMRG
jgi:hypothetical protein